MTTLVAFRIFVTFLGSGEGKGGMRGDREGGVSVFNENPTRGGVGGGGGEGAGRVSAGNFWGGGAKCFVSGPKFPPSNFRPERTWVLALRAKGTLISEPQFSTPLRDAIFPTRERENGLFKAKPSTKAVFPFSRGKNRISQGGGRESGLTN